MWPVSAGRHEPADTIVLLCQPIRGHFLPFQCSMMRWDTPGAPGFRLPPTAQQLDAAVQVIPFSKLTCQQAGFGVASDDHALYFWSAVLPSCDQAGEGHEGDSTGRPAAIAASSSRLS